jgi:hypothetical protein
MCPSVKKTADIAIALVLKANTISLIFLRNTLEAGRPD